MTAGVPEWVAASRAAQGLPEHVEDESTLAHVVVILRPELEVAA
jgi:hypothetical protein